MTRKTLSNHAAAAAAIRAELKRHGIKASVKSETYSMGSSVRVHIEADILPATRKEIEAFVGRFEYGTFDGMTDSYTYNNRNTDLPQVKYAFVSVSYSDAFRAELTAYVAAISGLGEHERDRYELLVLRGDTSWGEDFWRDRKAHVRL